MTPNHQEEQKAGEDLYETEIASLKDDLSLVKGQKDPLTTHSTFVLKGKVLKTKALSLKLDVSGKEESVSEWELIAADENNQEISIRPKTSRYYLGTIIDHTFYFLKVGDNHLSKNFN